MKKLGLLCVCIGVLLLIGAATWTIYNEGDDARAGAEAQEALTRLRAIIGAGGAEDGSPSGTGLASDEIAAEQSDAPAQDVAPTPMQTVVIDGYTYIGFLSVPEIGLELPVQSSWTLELLKKSPCWYSGSLSQSNLIIAGHNYKRHFTPLKQVSVGARVIFTDVGGKEYDYVVSKVLTVAGDDAETMLSDSEHWDLTLFTCTYGGGSRLTLRCALQAT